MEKKWKCKWKWKRSNRRKKKVEADGQLRLPNSLNSQLSQLSLPLPPPPPSSPSTSSLHFLTFLSPSLPLHHYHHHHHRLASPRPGSTVISASRHLVGLGPSAHSDQQSASALPSSSSTMAPPPRLRILSGQSSVFSLLFLPLSLPSPFPPSSHHSIMSCELKHVCAVGGNAISAFLSWRLQATTSCDVTLVWKSGFEAVSQYGVSFKYVPFSARSPTASLLTLLV